VDEPQQASLRFAPLCGSLRRAAMAFSPPLIDWEAESYPAYPDFAAIPLFVVFFLVVRFFLDRFVFEVVVFPAHFYNISRLLYVSLSTMLEPVIL
jgi:hypothetical protein